MPLGALHHVNRKGRFERSRPSNDHHGKYLHDANKTISHYPRLTRRQASPIELPSEEAIECKQQRFDEKRARPPDRSRDVDGLPIAVRPEASKYDDDHDDVQRRKNAAGATPCPPQNGTGDVAVCDADQDIASSPVTTTSSPSLILISRDIASCRRRPSSSIRAARPAVCYSPAKYSTLRAMPLTVSNEALTTRNVARSLSTIKLR